MFRLRNSMTVLVGQIKDTVADATANPFKFVLFSVLLLLGLTNFPFIFSKPLKTIIGDFNLFVYSLLVVSLLLATSKAFNTKGHINTIKIKIFENKWLCLIVLFSLFVCSLVIRLTNLIALDPYTDEIPHLLAGKKILSGESLTYTRATVVSYLISFCYYVGSPAKYLDYLFWGRVPGVIFGSLTIFPLYFLAKKISPGVGLLSCALWTICPWAIGVSRYAREYAFYPFLMLWCLISLISLFELLRKDPYANKLKIAFHLVIFSILVIYAVVVDPHSTIKIIFVVSGIVLCWYVAVFLGGINKNKRKRYLLFVLMFLLGLFSLAISKFINHLSLGYSIDARFLSVFLHPLMSSPILWWGGYDLFGQVALFILCIGIVFSGFKRDKYYFLLLLIFLGLLFFYYMFFNRYFRPRYCFYVLPFFTILIASGVYYLLLSSRLFKTTISKLLSLCISVCFLFPVIHYRNTIEAIGDNLKEPVSAGRRNNRGAEITTTGLFKVTGEYHQNLRDTSAFLKGKIQQEDVFITTVFRIVLILELNIPEERIFSYNYKRSFKEHLVENIISRYDQGWLILDYRRHGKFTPLYYGLNYPSYIGNTQLNIVRNRDEAQVFRWHIGLQ